MAGLLKWQLELIWQRFIYISPSGKKCLEACDEVIQSGKYELFPDFRNVFLPENDNCSEIIFCDPAVH